jgi:hypothetical protein
LCLVSIQIDLKILIFIGIIISFFLSEKLIEMYYTDESPNFSRYLIFLLIILLSIFLMILFSFLSGLILHRISIC